MRADIFDVAVTSIMETELLGVFRLAFNALNDTERYRCGKWVKHVPWMYLRFNIILDDTWLIYFHRYHK